MNENGSDIARAAARWWQELSFEGDGISLRRSGGAKRAALATLRRASGSVDALMIPEALDLYRRLREIDPRIDPDKVAAVAVALANLKPNRELLHAPSVSRAIGRSSFDERDSALLSEGRFRRLLQEEDAGLLEAFRRLVRFMGGEANPASLADAILNWGDPVRKRWIFDYYAVLHASPQ